MGLRYPILQANKLQKQKQIHFLWRNPPNTTIFPGSRWLMKYAAGTEVAKTLAQLIAPYAGVQGTKFAQGNPPKIWYNLCVPQ